MASPETTDDLVGKTFDLLGDVSSLALEKARLGTVGKEWGSHRGSEANIPAPTLVILTTKDKLKAATPPIGQSRFAHVLSALRPNFRKVFAYGQQVLASETESARHILTSGHVADATLIQNGYCLAIQPTRPELATLRSREYQLLHTSYFFRHNKRERTALMKEWQTAHQKVFKGADIVRDLSLVFEVTPRTIYNDLKHITKNA